MGARRANTRNNLLGADVIDQFLTPQFRRFLITGGLAACVNVGSRMIYDRFMPYSAAIVVAYLTGMATAYLLARRYVFTDSERKHSESSFRFAIVNAFGILQTWLVSIALGDHLLPAIGITRHAHDLAHLAGVASPVFTSFIAHRRWTFSSDEEGPARQSPETAQMASEAMPPSDITNERPAEMGPASSPVKGRHDRT